MPGVHKSLKIRAQALSPFFAFCPYAGNIFALKHWTVIKKWRIFTKLVKFVVHANIFSFFPV
jgi:hypothetical protein